MAFDLLDYEDPGVYPAEVVVPTGANLAGQAFTLTLIGTGSRTKRVTAEMLQRGQVKKESLTLASSTPYVATLSKRCTRALEHTQLYRTVNGIETQIPDSFISFNAAFITGAAGPYGTLAAGSVDAFCIELDRKKAVTLHLVFDGPSTSPAVTLVGGTQAEVKYNFTGGGIATATRADVALCINAALFNFSFYGASYGNATGTSGVASGAGAALVVTSPIATVDSDVRVFAAIAQSATAAIFGSATLDAASIVKVSDDAYDATATYKLDYVLREDVDTNLDALLNTQVKRVRTVGPFQGSGQWVQNTSWKQAGTTGSAASIVAGATSPNVRLSGLVSNANRVVGGLLTVSGGATSLNNGTFKIAAIVSATSVDVENASASVGDANNGAILYTEFRPMLDWSLATTASYTGTKATDSYTLTAGSKDLVIVNVDGGVDLELDLVQANPGAGLQVLGFTYALPGASAAAVTAKNIAALVANNANYGARYNACAVAAAGAIKIVSPKVGRPSSVKISGTTTNHTTTVDELFGAGTSTGLPLLSVGAGEKPALGSLYFTSYDYIRPLTDYGVPQQSFTPGDALDKVGSISIETAKYNPLAIAVQLAFANGAPAVYTVQVDDTGSLGAPSRDAVQACLNAAKKLDACTEILVLDSQGTSADTMADVIAHLEGQNAPTEKHYRRGWFGVPVNTAAGDKDTAGTIAYIAGRTLQVSAASVARGRMFLVAPPQKAGVTATVLLGDRTTVQLTLDSTYLAAAAAGLRTALLLASDSLAERTLTGFDTATVTSPWEKGERKSMVKNGALVVTFDANRFVMLDPVSTDIGGIPALRQDSASYQKDNVTRRVVSAIDSNLKGVVPFDEINFIADLKLTIAGVLAGQITGGNIGPFRVKDTGQPRDIDMDRDIIVFRSKTDPTKFFFRYWYNLLYPALRFVGEYSVDNPFFSRSV